MTATGPIIMLFSAALMAIITPALACYQWLGLAPSIAVGLGLALLIARIALKAIASETHAEKRWPMAYWVLGSIIVDYLGTPMETLLPGSLRTLLYRFLGASIGRDSIIFGKLVEPQFINIGKGAIVGEGALLMAHSIERGRVQFGRIHVGDGATIGARAIVMPGCTIEAGATLAAGAVLPRNTNVPEQATWGGVPAKAISA
jgi:hypothetical protein